MTLSPVIRVLLILTLVCHTVLCNGHVYHSVQEKTFPNFSMWNVGGGTGLSGFITCNVCNGFFSLVLNRNLPAELITSGIKLMCQTQFTQLNGDDSCSRIVETYAPVIDFIKWNSNLTSNEACGILIGHECLNYQNINSPNVKWTVNLPPPSPYFGKRRRRSLAEPPRVKKFIQLTDVHLDLNYSPGTNAACNQPICCQQSSGQPSRYNETAGWYGDYRNCDSPILLLDLALRSIQRDHSDAQFLVWTGDNVPHSSWAQTHTSIADYLKLTSLIMQAFSQSTGITVVPSLGNHESVPLNQFSSSPLANQFLSTQWIYDNVASLWAHWIPDQSSIQSLKSSGSYVKRLPGTHNLVAIVVNTNYCMRLNFMSLTDPQDPDRILQWLNIKLLEAEQNGDHVFLVMHIPPDLKECSQTWLFNYLRIIDRFKNIIRVQVSGHTHLDELRVYFSPETDLPIGVNFVAPSLTPYAGTNPSYRVFEYDDSTHEIINISTYTLDLTEANKGTEFASFKKSSDARSFHNLTSLSPTSFAQVISQLRNNDNYYRNYFTNVYTTKSSSMRLQSRMSELQERIADVAEVRNILSPSSSRFFVQDLMNPMDL